MARAQSLDKSLLTLTAVLFAGGLLILLSASMVLSYKNFGFIGSYAIRQFLVGMIGGGIALWICARIPYRKWKKFALAFILVSFVLLGMLFVPHASYEFGGARRWLKLGPVNFQPSELLKLAFIVYLASWLDTRRREVASVSRV